MSEKTKAVLMVMIVTNKIIDFIFGILTMIVTLIWFADIFDLKVITWFRDNIGEMDWASWLVFWIVWGLLCLLCTGNGPTYKDIVKVPIKDEDEDNEEEK